MAGPTIVQDEPGTSMMPGSEEVLENKGDMGVSLNDLPYAKSGTT